MKTKKILKLFFFAVIVNLQLNYAQTITFTHPDGGDFYEGLFGGPKNGTFHIRHSSGVRFHLKTSNEQLISESSLLIIRCTLRPENPQKGRRDHIDSTQAIVQIPAYKDWQEVNIPLSAFDYQTGREGFLDEVKHIDISVKTLNGYEAGAEIKDLTIPEATSVQISTPICSKPLDKSGKASYPIIIKNTSTRLQSYSVHIQKHGWEGMDAQVSTSFLQLSAGEDKEVIVEVTESEKGYIPEGSHEEQTLVVAPLLGEAEVRKLKLITLKPIKGSFIVHTEEGWNEVKEKIRQYDWAQKELEDFIEVAENFRVPEAKASPDPTQRGHGIIPAYIEDPLFKTAVAYKLTGNRKYGEKVAELLRRCAHPQTGYPYTLHLTFQSIPQEGGTFEGLLRGYDLIKNEDFFTPTEQEQIHHMFRLFCQSQILSRHNGGVSNWSVFNLGPAAQCALLLHDLHLFEEIVYGNNGLIDQFRYGALDDGWWYEMSLSYNLGTATCLTQVGLVARNFGIDLLHTQFPSSLTRKVGLRPFEFENYQGMAFGKFGPLTQPGIGIKRMWDGIIAYPDYRGVMFGMGDGHEERVAGPPFELAYYAYRDPAFASIIRKGHKRDLIYGVAELPEQAPDYSRTSSFSPNAGLAVLRSQTMDRPQNEQIQAALKYGTHGSYHGHFDRLSLVSLMRYGRSFYNPETSWFGYSSYMYKWWVQPSLSHNMVVVDGLQQEPTPCNQLLFHSGPMLQVVCAETNARWSHPPYMGGYDQIEDIQNGNRPYVYIPQNHPVPTDIGTYSEPIHQRRLMAVTDDFVLIADYLQANTEIHQFDNLFQLRGAFPSKDLIHSGHQAQWSSDPLSSGQFITNVNKYNYKNGGMVQSIHHFSGKNYHGKNWETGGINHTYSVPGDLHIDVSALWPLQGEISIGTYAESWPVRKKMEYEISVDREVLLKGSMGTWILGKLDLEIDLRGKESLTFRIRGGGDIQRNLMLGDGVILTKSGKEIPLYTLQPLLDNVLSLPDEKADYEGGPIVIAGMPVQQAIGIEPEDRSNESILTFNLAGLDAITLKGILGGDFPVGQDNQVRKTVTIRQQGKEACFLTLLEPYEKKSVIQQIKTRSASEIEVLLTDGRVQLIKIENFYSPLEKNPKITMEERKGNVLLRCEKTE